MPENRLLGAEYDRQRSLMKKRPYFSSLLLIVLILFFGDLIDTRSPLDPGNDSRATVNFDPVTLPASSEGWNVAGAWILRSDDPRVSGLSSLSHDGERLVTVSDHARLFYVDPPIPDARSQTLPVHVLTAANGAALRYRDTEALAIEGDRIWIGREGAHALLAYRREDRRFEASYEIDVDWPRNGGAEAVISPHDDTPLIILAERRKAALSFDGDEFAAIAVNGIKGWPTDATRLPDGRILVLSRTIGPLGFGNWIAVASYEDGSLRVGQAMRLPLSFRDNAEGITAAPLPDGTTRLWIVTDDNGSRYMRTLLVALDMKAGDCPNCLRRQP